jgi:hypothetical protein
MATGKRGPVGSPFGIAHATVVPENFDPDRDDEDDERRSVGEGPDAGVLG